MTEEYLKIVDENNIPTGKDLPRSLAHKTGLLHRVVYVYLFRRTEGTFETVVNLRAKTKDTHPNMWVPWLGGHVKSGENELQTVVDELREEVNLDIDPAGLIDGGWRYKEEPKNNREFNKIYFYAFAGNLEDLRFSDGEVQKVRWLSSDDIERAIAKNPEQWVEHLPDFKKVIADLKKRFYKN